MIGGCAFAPGLFVPDSALSYGTHNNGLQVKDNSLLGVALDITHEQETAVPAFVTTIDANVINAQERARAEEMRRETDNAPCGRTAAKDDEYRIGPEDVLSFTVWDHPELTSPGSAAAVAMTTAVSPLGVATPQAMPADSTGHTVSKRGTIFFPYVGEISVAGRTVDEIRSMLTRSLAQHIIDPQIDVHIVSYRSKRVYITGEVKNPGAIPITDTTLNVADAVTRAQGFTPEADAFRARLTRGQHNYPLDLTALFNRGDLSQNCLLQDGDIINVPNRQDSRVYVMGEVMKVDVLHMHEGQMSLAEAINLTGGLNQESSDAKRVFVIRGAGENTTSPLVYHLNLSSPDALLLSTRFALKPLDVVYVSTAAITRWNRVVGQILPLVSTLSSTSYYASH